MKTVTFDDSVWQLVPVEPTQEMRLAGVAAQSEKLKRYALGGSLPPIDHGIPDAYSAMLAAAPKFEGGAARTARPACCPRSSRPPGPPHRPRTTRSPRCG